jgi:TolB-like protein/DNA-binding winged helix-turn-helix (wHTH) protein
MQNKAFEFGSFRLEVRERRLTRDGHSIPLRGRVFDTLYILVSRHGCLVTKAELMAAIWPDSIVEETNLNHNICVLRRALGEKATGQKYVETVPRQGYRFVAEVRELDDPDGYTFPRVSVIQAPAPATRDVLPDETISTAGLQAQEDAGGVKQKAFPASRSNWYGHHGVISSLAVSVLLVVGYLGLGQFGFLGRTAPQPRVMLAVLPFENLTGDSSQKYIADGFSHEIIGQLGRWNTARVGVIAHASSRIHQGMRKSIGGIGSVLGVDYVVEGSLRRSKDGYRVTVMLIRVDDQAHLWAANYNQTADNVTALQVEVARLVIREIGSRIQVEPDDPSHSGYPQSLDSRQNDFQRLDALVHPADTRPDCARLLISG